MSRVKRYTRPTKRRASRKTASKRYVRRMGMVDAFRRGALSYRIGRSLNPFPKILEARHKYCETITIPAGAAPGVTSGYIFRANGIFDPNQTGVGHQPMYRDEMSTRYSNYIVTYAYVSVVLDQTDTTQHHYGIVLDDDSGGIQSDPTTAWEQYGGTGPLVLAQRNKPLKLTKAFSAYKEFRTNRKGLLSDQGYRTAVGSDPSGNYIRFFSIWRGPVDPAVTSTASKVCVKIIYKVLWLDPTDSGQS